MQRSCRKTREMEHAFVLMNMEGKRKKKRRTWTLFGSFVASNAWMAAPALTFYFIFTGDQSDLNL